MIHKSIMAVTALGLAAAFALPALAESGPSIRANTQLRTASSTDRSGKTGDPAKIACVGAAVATREAALGSGIAALTASIEANYAARASALAKAYSLSTNREVKAAVKTAWAAFNSSQKAAQRTWKAARDAAWKSYRSAFGSCKASGEVSDQGNASAEVAGT